MRKLGYILFALIIAACGSTPESSEKVESEIVKDSIIVDTVPPFESIPSNFNTTDLVLPEGFTYTILFSEGDLVTKADGVQAPAKGKHDLSVFIPSKDEPDTKGILYISHETASPDSILGDGGGATVFDLELIDGRWQVVGDFKHVDFSPVGLTEKNCGGSLGPNGNVFTCEETWGYNDSYFDQRNYDQHSFGNNRPMWQNMGYVVEVDPYQRKAVKRHISMGKLVHEDIYISEDGLTAYITDDYDPGIFVKMEMPAFCDFDHGELYAWKSGTTEDEPGSWIALPNDTTSLANIRKIAVEKGATLIVRHEWIEEVNGKFYICETGKDFMNWDQSLALGGDVPPWVEKYCINENGVMDDPFGRILEYDPSTETMRSYLEGGMLSDSIGCFSNPDCITSVVLNGKTYLVLSEDINWCDRGRVSKEAEMEKAFYNEVYFLDLSIESPTVEDLMRFAVAPLGAETTGVIFLPDGSMIMNIQHPKTSNPSPFNKSCTVLIEGF